MRTEKMHKIDKPIDWYFSFDGIPSASQIEKIMGVQTISFLRGEISALKWVLGASSLEGNDVTHINNRIGQLEDALAGKVDFDKDPTKPRDTDFYKGD